MGATTEKSANKSMEAVHTPSSLCPTVLAVGQGETSDMKRKVIALVIPPGIS